MMDELRRLISAKLIHWALAILPDHDAITAREWLRGIVRGSEGK